MAVAPAHPMSWRSIALAALAAGIAGGVAMDAYLWISPLASEHPGLPAIWSAIAVAAAGKTMRANPNAPWIGLGIHALISIAWAGAYAYAAASTAYIRRLWYVSGPVFGLIVYALMQILLLASGGFEYPHSPNDFVSALVAHAIFFGLPVALVVDAVDRG